MWTIWNYCTDRYGDHANLKAQAEALSPETRQSLAEKIVQTLEDADEPAGDDSGAGSGGKIEEVLEKLELDLDEATKQLATFEEKEQFLSVRIRKYQGILKEQDAHLQELHKKQQEEFDEERKEEEQKDANDNSGQETTDDEQQQQQQKQQLRLQKQQHYQEQLEKQQSHKEALGKVVDMHMDIMKHVKDCKRTIASLEQKKYELTNVTKRCREFLVMAEEAERSHQLGIVHDNNDLELMEPLNQEERQQNDVVDEENATSSTAEAKTNDDRSGNDPHVVVIDDKEHDSNNRVSEEAMPKEDHAEGKQEEEVPRKDKDITAAKTLLEVPVGGCETDETSSTLDPAEIVGKNL